MNRPGAGRGQAGYTLIEVIVAFAVLGLGLMLLLGTLSNGTRQVRWAADAGRAALHARSLLDGVGLSIPVVPGQRNGSFEDGRYRWTLAIVPYVDPELPPAEPLAQGGPQVYELTLAMDWGEAGPRERLQVRTLRLHAPEQTGPATP
ncbi:prepilin-type N-terminal cleavage/methylation domain-containing protein [Luteimonas sp. S4-F44]|uniref:type II secretion system protein XpsI n=1 Tax=Luteimonas sp. S4-F44 TaxID=2925842 RepID=UPI001F53B88C|nr:prepilin-type N-terminal cleavage/methylation domain-containing protein [Luteimonas sp. S4-F44]UNK43042.1 prepilin-type N-terminal cleavage/methylation domain-containing protein [Luteimonas sp. S4-F44]